MRIPFNWLKDYVEIHESAEEIARGLQRVGIPVEHIERLGEEITGVVAGIVEALEAHPDADRLRVAQVRLGAERLQIVTAAPNVRPGQRVAVAVPGARLAGGQKIQRARMRGVESQGMMCSAAELGMDGADLPPEQREGILDLPESIEPGQDVCQALGLREQVLVLETFANRPDQLSILGIAREVAAWLDRPLRLPDTRLEGEVAGEIPADLVTIEDPEGCPRYIGRLLTQVRVAPAPGWMARRLQAAGVRSINNVVDVTNYVMLETGQPLHAFDRSRLEQGRVVVRRSRPGEKIVTIDGAEHELPPGTLVIADAARPVAVAGVMGGKESEVGEDTRELLLESASFAPAEVRRASLRLGLRTESSRRFEKGLDWHRVALGSERVARLLAEIGAARPVRGCLDVYARRPAATTVSFRPARANKILGSAIPPQRMQKILDSLGFRCQTAGEPWQVEVPSHRQDVVREEDLVEEVARHYGYDEIPSRVPGGQPQGATPPQDEGEEWAREAMSRLGFSEVITPSLHPAELLQRYRVEASPLTILNPLSEDQRALRPVLFPQMAEVVGRNLRARNRDLRLFEVARVYLADGQACREPLRLALALCVPGQSFFELKGVLERLAEQARVDLRFSAAPRPWLHPGRAASLKLGGQEAGWAGELHPGLAAELDISERVALAELDLELLLARRVR
ncbi:MAG TPA: phenylalanine--tRNA ligase subunit beta, partial [Candidatus Nitrosotenuis sp.]|nr:phenylalanine--tRNA ligase subunit beta [Candidatus Nitrosotenuis sp.]